MLKDTWIIIGVMVTLIGLLATFMVISLTSIESRLTTIDGRLAAMDGRIHEMNTRISRIEGHLNLPSEIEPIQFETMDEVIIFKEDGPLVLERRDAEVFLDAIVNPSAPNERLRAALEEHARRVPSG